MLSDVNDTAQTFIKSATDHRCFVQFIHPGGEHGLCHGDWNRGKHKRKFLRCMGRQFGQVKEEPLHFWGEWEAPSDVSRIKQPAADGPQFVHAPYYVLPTTYCGHQNTDPFVFGSGFLYCRCQQYTGSVQTRLRCLEKGSVILFGSCRRQAFVLDTVFVVRDWIEYAADNYMSVLPQFVCEEFVHVTLLPLYGAIAGCSKPPKPKGSCDEPDPRQSWRLYRGATPEEPVEGMFSFFPCQPAVESSNGFARPRIAIPKLITNALQQGKKLTRGLTVGEIKKHFQEVRGQVESTGLSLGIYAELPRLRKGATQGGG